MKQLFGHQQPLPEHVFFHLNELLSPKVFALDVCFSRENPTMIRVIVVCGQALSERALWRLLRKGGGLLQ